MGDVKPVTQGRWCAPDGAFAIPIVPFPEGPTEIHDGYGDGGVTCTLSMLDANESVVEIVRTGIRPDMPEKEVLPYVAAKLQGSNHLTPEIRIEWIKQDGHTQIEAVNPASSYGGRADRIWLALGQGTSSPSKGCRVDRHLVGGGYYFQIIAAVVQPEAPSDAGTVGVPEARGDACAIASEMAAWAAAHLRVGDACGR